MSVKVTVPNTSSDSVVFGSANTPTAAEVVGIDSGSSNGQLAFKTTTSGTSTERMRIDSSGNLLVNTTTSNGKFTVNGGVGAQDFVVGYDITGLKHIASQLIYDRTAASAANVFVSGSGTGYVLQRSTSSLKYKTNVQDTTHGLNDVLKLRSVTYKGINDGDKIFGGLIAEEVHEAGLTEFVQYAEDGSPDALAYGQMVALAFKAIQEQQELIKQLQADVAALKGTA